MPSFIDVKNLSKRYGSYVALDNVSIEVAEGEFLALLGPSGCGKTTLLRSIAGFIESTSGDIFIDGKSMSDLPPNRRPVNTVFQNYALFPHMTVGENVAYGPRRNGVSKAEARIRAEESLTTVGMFKFQDRYPTQLSGGQQQRVALARAIANRPKVLLLDEPLGALDLKLRKQMQFELKALQTQLGMTFIFVTHDQEEALVMADRIAIMEAGRIVQIGTGEQIYRAPISKYVADFIGDANLIECSAISANLLEASIGNLKYSEQMHLTVGARVTYLVRPEAVTISSAQTHSLPGYLGFDAIVTNVVFVGNATRVYVDVNGQTIVSQYPSSVKIENLHIGQRVQVQWAVENGRVLVP